MWHPFDVLPPRTRGPVVVSLTAATLLLMAAFQATGGPVGPGGIVPFEVAGTAERAAAMMKTWGESGSRAAAFSLGLDFLFIPVYSTAISFGCAWTAGRFRPGMLHRLGILLAWGLWVAALLDCIENVALLVLLLDRVIEPWPHIAAVCAWTKFALISLGLAYLPVARAAGTLRRNTAC